ncbi:3'-5' RNA nuclease TATDN2 [Pelodytes ibericus]
MAAGDGTRKHKWSSPIEMSPSKYLKGTESKLPRRVSYSKAQESESPSRVQDRHVTLYHAESGTRESDDVSAEDVCSSFAAAKNRFRENRKSILCSHASAQPETSADMVRSNWKSPSTSFTLKGTLNVYNNDDKPSSQKDSPRSRKPRAHIPSMLFKRAFRDILGSPVRAKPPVSREPEVSSNQNHETEEGDHEAQAPGARIPKLSTPESDSLPSQSNLHNETSPDGDETAKDCKTEAELPESRRLVFIYEEDSDKDINVGDILEKDPSIGSDFSDVEDVRSLARFSQDDPDLSCCSMPQDSYRPSSGYIMYPSHMYKSPWCNYTDQWISNSIYRPETEHTTLHQEESNTSHVLNRSVTWSDDSAHSVSSEGARDLPRERSGSFDSSWISGKTNQTRRRLSDTFLVSDAPSSPTFLEDGFIDTHCHLDMLFNKLSFKGSFASFRKEYSTTFPKEFQGCIADFCDPGTLHDSQWQQLLGEDMVWGAFGCHPHFAQYFNEQKQEEILKALQHPKAIAYGEMGLDYSHKCSTKIPVQHKVFEDQLKLAVALGKPLVIHCRDADDDLLRIMKKLVPSDYKIHRHCFTGSYRQIQPFLNEFPNMAVGFTALLTYQSAHQAKEAMTLIPLERLIVETDAPYFLPRQVPKGLCKFAHPGLALHTVQEIAKLRNTPVKSVLMALRKNTRQLYNL